jgi:hypothetical protein
MFIGLIMTGIVTGLVSAIGLWSRDPVLSVVCAPLIASFITGFVAVSGALLRTDAQRAGWRPATYPGSVRQPG